jgi:hypothetical protein
MISDQHIDEIRAIYSRANEEGLAAAEARGTANKLVTLCLVIMLPLPNRQEAPATQGSHAPVLCTAQCIQERFFIWQICRRV